MKKIICITLVVLLMFFSIIGVRAEVNTETLKEEFYNYYTEYTVVPTDYPVDVKIVEVAEVEDIVIFKGVGWLMSGQAEYKRIFGDWYSVSLWGAEELSVMDVYVKAGDKIYSLETAWDNNLVTDLSPLVEFESVNFYPMGDINGDKVVNIKDATTLQKYLANINTALSISNTYDDDVFDVNGDGNVNIRDATTIQKRIAKFDM